MRFRTSIFVCRVGHASSAAAAARAGRLRGTVVKSSMSKEQEAELQTALHGEQAPVSTSS